MARDPRTYLTVDCGPTQADAVAANARKRNFFSALGKIGDIELLNEVNAGNIGAGLRTLASISDSIRNGKPGSSGLFGIGAAAGAVLDSVNASAEAATDAVLGAVGINATAATLARDFNPGVVNRAFGQASAIATKVKQGNFGVGDIPSVFQDIQNLDKLLSGIYTPDKVKEQTTVCEPSPYAQDLVARQPKFKFLFVVEFKVNPELLGGEYLRSVDIAFVVHNSSRPNIEFEYEDINMYNLRTRVAKRTMYQPMTMRFYDDDFNQAFDFYTKYLKYMSPIANFPGTQIPNIQDQSIGVQYNETGYDQYGRFLNSSSSLGALAGGTAKSILNEIRLYHLFNWGQSVNIYQFLNPRITSMELDELNMAESGPTEVSLQFAYDGVRIIPYGRFVPGATNPDLTSAEVDLGRKSQGINNAYYPLHYSGDSNKDPFSNYRVPEGGSIPEAGQTATVVQPSGAQAPTQSTQDTLNLNTPIRFEQADGTFATISKSRAELIREDLSNQLTDIQAKADGGETTYITTYPNGNTITTDIGVARNRTEYQLELYGEGINTGNVSREKTLQLQQKWVQPTV